MTLIEAMIERTSLAQGEFEARIAAKASVRPSKASERCVWCDEAPKAIGGVYACPRCLGVYACPGCLGEDAE